MARRIRVNPAKESLETILKHQLDKLAVIAQERLFDRSEKDLFETLSKSTQLLQLDDNLVPLKSKKSTEELLRLAESE
jgi:hypothetical protein